VKNQGGKPQHVLPNKDRQCSKFMVNAEAFAHEADKIYEKSQIPLFAPTWRYWADKKELKETGEEKGPKFIQINPGVNKHV